MNCLTTSSRWAIRAIRQIPAGNRSAKIEFSNKRTNSQHLAHFKEQTVRKGEKNYARKTKFPNPPHRHNHFVVTVSFKSISLKDETDDAPSSWNGGWTRCSRTRAMSKLSFKTRDVITYPHGWARD